MIGMRYIKKQEPVTAIQLTDNITIHTGSGDVAQVAGDYMIDEGGVPRYVEQTVFEAQYDPYTP